MQFEGQGGEGEDEGEGKWVAETLTLTDKGDEQR